MSSNLKSDRRAQSRLVGLIRLLGACLLVVRGTLLGIEARADSWDSFQNGGAVSVGAAATGGSLDQLEESWKIPLAGYGQSSPVLWNETVYVTSVEGAQKETYHVAAYGLQQGQELWRHDLRNATPQENSTYVSRAAPTPAVDESGLYVFFEGGNLLKLSHEGKILWERNLVADYGAIESRHGLGASLEQNDTSLFVWVERSEDPYLLSIDKQSGKTIWKSQGAGATSWSSPRLIPVSESQSHLVLSAIGSLTGIDPTSGEQLWTFAGIAGNSTPTPIPLGKGRFLIGATVGRGENESGLRPAESNGVVQIHKQNESWHVDFLWRAEEATSSFGSPIAHNGLAFFVNKTGGLFCLDAESGKEVSKVRLGGSIWSTPYAEGDRLYLFLKEGVLKIYSADQNLRPLSEMTIFSQPAEAAGEPFAGKTLYAAIRDDDGFLVRTGSELIRLVARSE